mmetsp:Transcript_79727/g.221897  ORF Transcript_79727/g.221897 Transcript_79727/m.221897 type:complete len:301 (+) Transcript_79727:109-1011(+)
MALLCTRVATAGAATASAFGAGARFRARPPTRFEKLPKAVPLFGRAAEGNTTAASSAEEAGVLVADVRYDASQRLLLVGEASFTFAAALGKRFGDCSALTATSFESRDELIARFGDPLAKRIAALENRLCGIHHSLPANTLAKRFREGSFDCVAFNFPLGYANPSIGDSLPSSSADLHPERARIEHHGNRFRQNYADLTELLGAFFHGAAHILRPGGECHLRLTDQYATVRGLQMAYEHGLHLVTRLDFNSAFENVYKPLGYRPAAVDAPGAARRASRRSAFSVRNSSTFVFRRGVLVAS